MKVLITGGAGFIGAHVVDYLLRNTDWTLTIIDRLDSSGNLNRLAEVGAKAPRVRFIYHDLKSPLQGLLAAQIGRQDYVIHMAAATHVDRSIECPMEFVLDNVVATCNVLDYVRLVGCEKMIHFSTDEVFGPAPPGTAYKEDDRFRSGNPYAATKAGAEELAVAYHNTYKLPVLISHTMNVIGERQHPEKFVPMTISLVDKLKRVTIHADKTKTKAGSRFYIHAQEVANAMHFLLDKGLPGEKYNIVGEREMDNLELARHIATVVGKPLYYDMVDFHSSRPGHDLRYALDGTKMALMGWKPRRNILDALAHTVRWTLDHPQWVAEL